MFGVCLRPAIFACAGPTLTLERGEALRKSEGFGGVAAFPERDVSLVEAMNTEQAIVSEALALFDEYFAYLQLRT